MAKKNLKDTDYLYISTYLRARERNLLTAVRMERARKMLRETALPVSRIAALLGYTHFSNFSNMFRKKNRLSPAEYRKQFMEGRQGG